MLVDIVLGSKAVWRLLSILAEAPGQGITKEEIRKITKLGGDSLFNSINALVKNDILSSKKVGKRTYYRLNLTNKYSKPIVEIVNIERKELNNMNPKIVTILREYTRVIRDVLNPESIFVFGSIVKSSYREDSDIDIAIIIEKEPETNKRTKIEKVSEKLEKRFGRELQTHFFTKQEFKDKKNKLVEQVHRDGIKLL